MSRALYTFGYVGGNWPRLEELMSSAGAVLVDVRFKASGRPGTAKRDFERRFGEKYLWVQSLGNELYRSSAIKIHNPAAGVPMITGLLEAGRVVVLMCACSGHEECHRSLVAKMIGDALSEELEIIHLPPAGRMR